MNHKSPLLNWILPILIIFIWAFDASGQAHYTSRVFLGAKGGVEMSRVFFNPSVKQSMSIGSTAGIMFRYTEERNFALLAELNFSQRGWKEDLSPSEWQYRRTINYLDLPVMTQIYFGRRGKFFFNVGPQVSMVLSDSYTSNFDINDVASLDGYPNKGRVHDELTLPIQNKFDFGINAGLGGEFSIAPKHSVMLEARFYYGIGNIFSNGYRDPFRASNSMAISVSAGYWFRIK